MRDTACFFAVDLGATSGRTVIGRIADGQVVLEELTRFPNDIIHENGHYYWDIQALYEEIVSALKLAKERGFDVRSIGIDTWGVDFVCIGVDNRILSKPLSYRDPHTVDAMEQYFRSKMPQQEVYDKTGIQFMNFNSLFQLYAMRRDGNEALDKSDMLLFMPDALSWMLTGEKVCEYTIASTSQLLNPRTKELDEELLNSVGLSRQNFGRMVLPGQVIGTLKEEIQQQTGLGSIPVVAVAGHDTASAVAAVPASGREFAYLSSGTWSLMGIESRVPIINKRSYNLNFTNEGGIEGTTRFLKNICGMWLIEQCRRIWKDDAPSDYATLFAEAMQIEPCRSLINPDDKTFAMPENMVDAICDYCRQTDQPVPSGYAEITRCILDSLALRYRQVFSWLQEMAEFPIETLHIIGGGSKNDWLNQLTANSTGAVVKAGPQECTALGNIMLQAKAAGLVANIDGMRRLIADSVEMKTFVPEDRELWNKMFEKFQLIINN